MRVLLLTRLREHAIIGWLANNHLPVVVVHRFVAPQWIVDTPLLVMLLLLPPSRPNNGFVISCGEHVGFVDFSFSPVMVIS